MKLKKITEWIKKNVPIPGMILYCIALLSLVIHLLCLVWQGFADFFSNNIAGFFRMVLAKISGLYRFSLAEILILMLPVIFIGIIMAVVTFWKREQEIKLNRFFAMAFAFISLFYSTFVFTYGMAYRGYTLDKKLFLDKRDISVEELQELTEYLAEKTNEAAESGDFLYGDASVMPYDFAKMNEKLNDAYAFFEKENDFFFNFTSRAKPMLLSKGMSYIHMLGMYTYYTGEANINIEFPDYTLPFTTAHEMAHQRGFAREDEANFMAFLICTASKDPYIRYSGYLNMYEYAASALYRADTSAYKTVYGKLCLSVRYEMQSYDMFFDKYRESSAANVSDALNDAFLKGNGQSAGTASYGLVVDLAAAYYRTLGDNVPK